MVTAHGTRVILAALLVAACMSLTARTLGAGAQEAPEEVIQIPIRWCALKDTTVATNPSEFGEPDTDSVLLRRLERASDQFWLPRANIVFRSAMTATVRAPASFPLIPDPNPPPPGSTTEVLGDIRGSAERDEAAELCKDAWEELADSVGGVTLLGPIALAVQHILNADGTSSGASGNTKPPTVTTSAATATTCTNPLDVATVTNGYMAVADPSTHDADVDDTTLVAHELGHLLNLGHGNGVDDDTADDSGPYDKPCDFWEINHPPTSFMDAAISDATDNMTVRQRQDSRAVAAKIEGAVALATGVTDFPICVPTPDGASPGDLVTVVASAFIRPGERVRLDLGDEPMDDGLLEASDTVSLDLTVPTGARSGLRLVTVAVEGSGLTAHCLIELA